MCTKLHGLDRKGLALVVVLLIVLAASGVALVSLKIALDDNKVTTAFQYNRQAASGAHQTAGFVVTRSQDPMEALMTSAEQSNEGINNAMLGGSFSDKQTPNWYRPDVIKGYSGLANTPPSVGLSAAERLLGDLSRPVIQAGALGEPVQDPSAPAGMSEADQFCIFTRSADAFTLIGRSVPLRGAGANRYYLLGDLNSRVAAFKREMGVLRVSPMTCSQ